MSFKEYYDTCVKKDQDGICLVCGSLTNFSTGSYRECCSNKCRSILSWCGADMRREEFAQRMVGNDLSIGRPAGSQNVSPYPVESAAERLV